MLLDRIQDAKVIYLLQMAAFLLIVLSGCRQSSPAESINPSTELTVQTESQTPPPQIEDDVTLEPGFRELVLWTPDFFDPYAGTQSADMLAEAYQLFEELYPDVHIEVQTKAEFGITNLQNYVRSARQVAPSILPDVILMDTRQLWRIVDIGLVAPLTSTNIAGMADMYPFALDSATYSDVLYGVPYTADVMHLAGRQSPNTLETPGLTFSWDDLLSTQQSYLFSAGGHSGGSNDSLLSQYVGAGGQLVESGELTDPEALINVLNFLSSSIQRGIIPRNVLDYSDQSTVWLLFEDGEVDFVDVSATWFLQERANIEAVTYASLPTQSGALNTVGHVWALAVLAQEPEQQALAIEFIEFMLEPQRHGMWTQQSNRLPTQRSALDTWENNPDPYYDFLHRLLEVAVALPSGAKFTNFAVQLQSAQLSVLNSEMSPEEVISLFDIPQ